MARAIFISPASACVSWDAYAQPSDAVGSFDFLMLNALQPVLETALDAVIAMRPDGRVAAWNLVAQKIFGWAEDEVIGRPLVDLIIPPQHREAHNIGLARYLRTGEAKILNRRVKISAIDRAQREFPVELSITTTRYEGEVLFIGFLRNITERRQRSAPPATSARGQVAVRSHELSGGH